MTSFLSSYHRCQFTKIIICSPVKSWASWQLVEEQVWRIVSQQQRRKRWFFWAACFESVSYAEFHPDRVQRAVRTCLACGVQACVLFCSVHTCNCQKTSTVFYQLHDTNRNPHWHLHVWSEWQTMIHTVCEITSQVIPGRTKRTRQTPTIQRSHHQIHLWWRTLPSSQCCVACQLSR